MIARIGLAALLLIVPFEPRFTVPFGFLRLSLVEAVAVPCFLLMAFGAVRRTPRIKAPLVALVLLFLVSLISAGLSHTDPARSFKFALRLGAMATVAILVSRLQSRDVLWGFRALAVSGSIAGGLALAEGLGARSLDIVLGVFREIPFNVAGVRRASAGSEYPNLGAAMILYALLIAVTLLRSRPFFRAALVIALTFGLAFTYSRGAWLAGFAGLGVAAWFESGRARFGPLALYLAVLGVFVGGAEISQLRLQGENANDFYAATYQAPRQIALDSSAQIQVLVKVRNVGRRPWRQAEEIHLSYHLYQNKERPLVDGPRTKLPRDVLPGESVTIEATLRAPRKPGEYLLMWDMVHENTTWFSGQGVPPGVARLIVGGDPDNEKGADAADPDTVRRTAVLTPTPDDLAWRPSRLDLWTIALRMWGDNPFVGEGPDNFRWTYGARAGKAVFDTRVFANNMFLEFAATLGTFGLASFMAALILALWGGWRLAPASVTALMATSILVAMAVHGLADYLLAFTGHYLVFGLAVGAISGYPDQESQ